MFKNLTQQVVSKMLQYGLKQMADCVDPSCFGDLLAERTQWKPLKGGGASFQTHKLVSVQRDRMEFRASAGAILFALLFFLIGVGAAAGAFLSEEQPVWGLAFFGLVFLSVGGGLLYFGSSPAVFDKRTGLFWKGRNGPDDVADLKSLKCCVRLGEIHALQIIAEHCKGKSSFFSYELNLVLKDASRINVVDHGSKDRIRADAAVLAKFLGKPLWDAAEMKILDAAGLAKTMEEVRKIGGGR